MTTVFNCNQKLSSHQLQVSIEVAQEWHFKSKTSSTHCASWIASDPPAACNIGTQVFACSSVTLWHISVHNQRALIYYTICRCKILPACNTGMLEMAAKICPPKSSQNLFWQIYSSSAIFSARLFYKMRLIRSSQAEFGQTIHLYTTSSRILGQPMYLHKCIVWCRCQLIWQYSWIVCPGKWKNVFSLKTSKHHKNQNT